MFVTIMCKFSENFPIERMAKSQSLSLLIIQLYGACSTQNAIRKEKEGLPFATDDKAFIST